MRKPRKLVEGARYHVIARANRKEMILDCGAMKALFVEVVERAKRKYDFEVENFCVMGNHFHLMVRPRKGTRLSSMMQWIMSVFAMAWNRIHHLTGHVWGERFFSRVIESLMEFMQVFGYIDENPVKAGLVGNRQDWQFGGLWHRRTGRRGILEPLSLLIEVLFPGHRLLILGAPHDRHR